MLHLVNLEKSVLRTRARARFRKRALAADDIFIDHTATCTNLSGNKENLSIGDHSSVLGALYVHKDASIRIGTHFYLGANAFVSAHAAITIGNQVVISDEVDIYDHSAHPADPQCRLSVHEAAFSGTDCKWQPDARAPLVIEDNVWIGSNTYIPFGVTIGEGSIISPDSVVIADVPPYAVVSGNPAIVIKMLQKPSQDKTRGTYAGAEALAKSEYTRGQSTASLAQVSFREAYLRALFHQKRYTVDGADAIELMMEANQSARHKRNAIIDEGDRRYSRKNAHKTFAGTSTDSLTLAVVRLITMIVGIATTMLLSRAFSLEAYGTYSQGSMIMSVAISFTTWGMLDAINFFFNQKKVEERQKYVDTVFTVIMIAGLLAGFVIFLFQQPIYRYFDNPKLSGILLYIAFRPLLENLISALQVMYISVGRAKSLALRNVIASVCRLLFAFITTHLTSDIATIFIGQLLFDVMLLEYLWITLFYENIIINPFKCIWQKIPEILRFGIPMAMHSLIKVLLKDIDKLFIGRYETTARYALYANATSPLPFDMIANAFLLVIFPILTKYFADKKYGKAQDMISGYIRISYITTLTLSMAVLLLSRESILFLYGEKYLPGTTIFMLYICVDIVRIFNISTVLSAKGWANKLMFISIGSVALNLVLNYVAYWTIGFIGPALATVVCATASAVVTCYISGKALGTRFTKLLNLKEVGTFALGLVATCGVSILLRNWLRSMDVAYFTILVSVGFFFIATMVLINIKTMLGLFRKMNAFRL